MINNILPCVITFVTNVIFLLRDICTSINSSTNKVSDTLISKLYVQTSNSPSFIIVIIFPLFSILFVSFVKHCRSGGQCNKSLRIYEIQYLICANRIDEIWKICDTIFYPWHEMLKEEKQGISFYARWFMLCTFDVLHIFLMCRTSIIVYAREMGA